MNTKPTMKVTRSPNGLPAIETAASRTCPAGDVRQGQHRKFAVVSLFTGAMGLDIGLEQTGCFKTVVCIEVEPAFCETIRRNRDAGRLSNRRMKVYQADITKLSPARVLRDLNMEPGELDLLIGGPPCQSFSTAGRRGTVQDARGTLIWQFLRYVKVMRPRFFLMENVRGLLSAALRHRPIKDRPEHGGSPLSLDEEPGSVVRLFADDLRAIGYRFDCFLVNAVNYGAPQLRERALFIGNRYGTVVDFPNPTHGHVDEPDQPKLFEGLSQSVLPFRTLGDAIRGLKEPKPVVMDFSPRKKRYLAMVPPGGNWRALSPEVQRESMGQAYYAKGGRSGWWRRLSYDLPCPTLVTMPNHAGTALCHPEKVRALSVREYAFVQEFPRSWRFVGTPQEQYAQVGNAVPVRLGRVAGEAIAKYMDVLARANWPRASGPQPRSRVVYVRSHVRTRQWFRAGRALVWREGAKNHHAAYGKPKTLRAEQPVLA